MLLVLLDRDVGGGFAGDSHDRRILAVSRGSECCSGWNRPCSVEVRLADGDSKAASRVILKLLVNLCLALSRLGSYALNHVVYFWRRNRRVGSLSAKHILRMGLLHRELFLAILHPVFCSQGAPEFEISSLPSPLGSPSPVVSLLQHPLDVCRGPLVFERFVRHDQRPLPDDRAGVVVSVRDYN